MVLFLDFDGVLHPQDHGGDLFNRRRLLWQILRACPHVQVVFSTAWRERHSLEELVVFTTAGGGEDLAGRFIGVTPVHAFDFEDTCRYREKECLAWLEAHGHPGPWLAVDDAHQWFSCPQLYLVDWKTGLTAEDAVRIIERLGPAGGAQ